MILLIANSMRSQILYQKESLQIGWTASISAMVALGLISSLCLKKEWVGAVGATLMGGNLAAAAVIGGRLLYERGERSWLRSYLNDEEKVQSAEICDIAALRAFQKADLLSDDYNVRLNAALDATRRVLGTHEEAAVNTFIETLRPSSGEL